VPPISYVKMLYRPMMAAFGVPATLTIDGTSYSTLPDGSPLIANDKTVGAQVNQQGGIQLETMQPQAEMIYADVLALGLTDDDLDDGTITLNSNTWNITSHKMNPSHNGVADGTVYLLLEGTTDG
jgi:hypothetical protein